MFSSNLKQVMQLGVIPRSARIVVSLIHRRRSGEGGGGAGAEEGAGGGG
jgi:uncharacterized membrane protein